MSSRLHFKIIAPRPRVLSQKECTTYMEQVVLCSF